MNPNLQLDSCKSYSKNNLLRSHGTIFLFNYSNIYELIRASFPTLTFIEFLDKRNTISNPSNQNNSSGR